MNPYAAELLGTAILVLLGNGVVANVVLSRTSGHQGGWIVITAGWGLAVFTAVMCVGQYSGAHLNPAVTVGLAVAGRFDWSLAPGYIAAQFVGAFLGALLVFSFYRLHYAATDDAAAKRATFCTSPSIRSLADNFWCELVGTFVLVFAVLLTADATFDLATDDGSQTVKVGLGSLGALPVGLVVFAIGLSLGGTTGYAINPARDLGPRIAHALLPIADKADNDWGYAPVPVVGPLLGAVAAALLAGVLSPG
jgi:glycerol uptake facilitator protein